MAYQNINQYNFRKWYLKPVNEITDLCLASDERNYNEEVIFSPYLIAETYGEKLPVYLDLNDPKTKDKIVRWEMRLTDKRIHKTYMNG